jgi:hypothetical protein
MVRVNRDQCQKSAGRQEIRKVWGDAWFQQSESEPLPHPPDIVIRDALQYLLSVGEVDMNGSNNYNNGGGGYAGLSEYGKSEVPDEMQVNRTYRSVLRQFKSRIEKDIKNSNVKFYVLGFDKDEHVPHTKGQTQQKRNVATKKNAQKQQTDRSGDSAERQGSTERQGSDPMEVDEQQQPLEPLMIESLDQELPMRWKEYLSDRSKYRKEIIAMIISNLLRGECQLTLQDASKVVIFEGHCIDAVEARRLINVKEQQVELDKNVENINSRCRNIPISIRKQQNSSGRVIRFEKLLENEIGETDFVPFFYIRRLTSEFTEPRSIEIISSDTDFMYLSLIFLHKLKSYNGPKQSDPEAIVHITLRQTSPYYRNKHSMEEYLHVNTLYDLVSTHFEGVLEHSVITLAVAMITSGSDYTDPHYFVPGRHFLNSLLEMAHHIKDLVDINPEKYEHGIVVRPDAYVRLLIQAYACARSDRLPDSCDRTKLTPLTLNGYMGATGKKKALEATKLFPCDLDIEESYAQVHYYTVLCYHVGEPCIRHLDPLQYGYELIDPKLNISKENLRRIIVV